MDELIRLRRRLILLLTLLTFRRRCMELTAEIGLSQVANAIKGRPLNYQNILLGGVTALLGIKVPEMIAKQTRVNEYSPKNTCKIT